MKPPKVAIRPPDVIDPADFVKLIGPMWMMLGVVVEIRYAEVNLVHEIVVLVKEANTAEELGRSSGEYRSAKLGCTRVKVSTCRHLSTYVASPSKPTVRTKYTSPSTESSAHI